MISPEDAVRILRADPAHSDLVRDAYLGTDALESAERFMHSAEFKAVERLLGGRLRDAVVLDVGAGNGIASYAFARRGARPVYALEPDPSDEVGQGAIRKLARDLPISIVAAYGESIPIATGALDVVYARQVLHHAEDVDAFVAECARVLRSGGVFLACREHVVDDERQLRRFRETHPIHRLTGGENAYPLPRYLAAIGAAGLELQKVLGPWDSVINAFPAVQSDDELEQLPRAFLSARLGRFGDAIARLPGVKPAVWACLNRPIPGRLYTFLSIKRT